MYRTQKSATCCYCGTKTVLSLSDGSRHELKCSACGAPLSKLKQLKAQHVEDAYVVGKTAKKKSAKKTADIKSYDKRRAKKKKKKSLAYRLFDAAEEIIDIFD